MNIRKESPQVPLTDAEQVCGRGWDLPLPEVRPSLSGCAYCDAGLDHSVTLHLRHPVRVKRYPHGRINRKAA